MIKTITIEDLLFMSDDEIRQFLNHKIACQTKNDNQIVGKIVNFECAANAPHLICGFILDSGKRISFGAINNLSIEK